MNTAPLPDPLLDAASALHHRGEPLSVSAVAREAGVARGTVYRRFRDRDALLAALVATGRLVEEPVERDARERALDALGALLRRQGLAEISLDEVAREAGLGIATIYRRFGDRHGLLRAFAAERTPRRLAGSLPNPGRSPEQALIELAAESITFLRAYRGLGAQLLWPGSDARDLFAEARQGSASVRELTALAVRAAVPGADDRVVLGFHGLLLAIAWGREGDVMDDAAFVVATLLRGARGEGTGAPQPGESRQTSGDMLLPATIQSEPS